MYCRPTKVLPAVVHPTKCCVNHNFENVIVPHVFPSHTTTVNHTNFQSQEHFPHSQSVVNEVSNTDIGPVPGPPPPPNVGGLGGFPGPYPGICSRCIFWAGSRSWLWSRSRSWLWLRSRPRFWPRSRPWFWPGSRPWFWPRSRPWLWPRRKTT